MFFRLARSAAMRKPETFKGLLDTLTGWDFYKILMPGSPEDTPFRYG
jgi:hypothetical protein